MGFLDLIGGEGPFDRGRAYFFLVLKQVPIGYFRKLEDRHFAYLNWGDPLLMCVTQLFKHPQHVLTLLIMAFKHFGPSSWINILRCVIEPVNI